VGFPQGGDSMQPSPPPPQPLRLPRRAIVVAVVLLVVGGIIGYLLGSAGLLQATLRVDVENRSASDLTAQISVNGRARQTLAIPTGQTVSADFRVTFSTAEGAFFEVRATAGAQQDVDTVFVDRPATFVVSLALG